MLHVKFSRDSAGKPTEFLRNQKVVNIPRYLHRKGVTEYDIVDFDAPMQLPPTVQCRTPSPILVVPPTPRPIRSPRMIRYQELFLQHLQRTFLYWSQDESIGTVSSVWKATSFSHKSLCFPFMDAEKLLHHSPSDISTEIFRGAYQRLDMFLQRPDPRETLYLVFRLGNLSDDGLTTNLWKYIASYAANIQHRPAVHSFFAFLYDMIQKLGVKSSRALVEQCAQSALAVLGKTLGPEHNYAVTAFCVLGNQMYLAEAQARFSLWLSGLESAARAMERAGAWGSKDYTDNLHWQICLQRLMVLPPDERIPKIYELLRALDHQFGGPAVDLADYKMDCLFELHLNHMKMCVSQPAAYNPRYLIATESLDEYITLRQEANGQGCPWALECLQQLENTYQKAGWTEKVASTRVRIETSQDMVRRKVGRLADIHPEQGMKPYIAV